MGTKQQEVGHTQMKNQSGIYEILNTINGKRYIGSTNNFPNRWRQHWQGLERGGYKNQILQKAWNKYGKGAFKFSPLLICAPTNEMLCYYEQGCLDAYKPGYNISVAADSPMRGRTHSQETRDKISGSLKGKPSPMRGRTHSQETRDKIAKANIGKTHSQETKDKIAKANKGRPPTMLGHIHSQETRDKISKALAGKPHSQETKDKISKANTGKKRGPYKTKRK